MISRKTEKGRERAKEREGAQDRSRVEIESGACLSSVAIDGRFERLLVLQLADDDNDDGNK
jgi:hypothetical protein